MVLSPYLSVIIVIGKLEGGEVNNVKKERW